MTNQKQEAETFEINNREAIKTARDLIAKAFAVSRPIIFDSYIKSENYQETSMNIVKVSFDKAAEGDFSFLPVIRGLHCIEVTRATKNTFWELVDATNFFHDATGTNWKYFTQEKREISLRWAIEGAQIVIDATEAIEAKETEITGITA